MPNYCFNRIKLNLSFEELIKIKERVFSKDDFGDYYFDFNKLIERPENTLLKAYDDNLVKAFSKYYYENPDSLDQELLDKIIKNEIKRVRVNGMLVNIDQYVEERYSKEELKNYNGEMLTLWHEWCVENWGTKWNSLFSSISREELIFSTAWHPISQALFERFIGVCRDIMGDKADKIWFYYEEDRGKISGRYFIQDGEIKIDTQYKEEEVA
ncbi:MAG: hypothetical protein ACRC4Y_07650 [Cetobacterium sp.]